jgi:hypothetical protein
MYLITADFGDAVASHIITNVVFCTTFCVRLLLAEHAIELCFFYITLIEFLCAMTSDAHNLEPNHKHM